MIPKEKVEKYLKIKALAEQGAGGEKESARRLLAKMEVEFPGIGSQAAKTQKQQDESDAFADGYSAWNEGPVPEPTANTNPRAHRSGSRVNWDDLLNFAKSAVNNAYDFASHVASAWVGRQLAEDYVTVAIRETQKSGNVSVIFRVSDEVLGYAENLNLVQQQAFRQVFHEMLDEKLNELMGTLDENEMDEDVEESL